MIQRVGVVDIAACLRLFTLHFTAFSGLPLMLLAGGTERVLL